MVTKRVVVHHAPTLPLSCEVFVLGYRVSRGEGTEELRTLDGLQRDLNTINRASICGGAYCHAMLPSSAAADIDFFELFFDSRVDSRLPVGSFIVGPTRNNYLEMFVTTSIFAQAIS